MTLKQPNENDLKKLFEYFQNKNYGEAEKLALSITKEFPSNQFSWKLLFEIYRNQERMSESLSVIKKLVFLEPEDYRYHFYLGNNLRKLNRNKESQISYKKSIEIKSDFASGYLNLGITLENDSKLIEAEKNYKKARDLNPNFFESYYNLGNIYLKIGDMNEAEKNYRKAVELNPDFATSYLKLGNILQEVGKNKEAEILYRQAIALDANIPDAHVNLGWMLRGMGKISVAHKYIKDGISLNPNIAMYFFRKGIIDYDLGDIKSSYESLKIASSIDPNLKIIKVVKKILEKEVSSNNIKTNTKNLKEMNLKEKFYFKPFHSNRPVEKDLIDYLYGLKSRELDSNKPVDDARYGNGLCLEDFELFDHENSIIKNLKNDLMEIMRTATKSDIIVYASFFNILRGVSGSKPHRHISKFDKDKSLNLKKRKYSLVYYLSVGDQSSENPGILRLYDPDQETLPSNGEIIIIPSERKHSSIYSGNQDRVMIGVNFYII